MTCPFGHLIEYAGDHLYYCDHRICGVAFFKKKNKMIVFTFEELEQLLAGEITRDYLLKQDQKRYEERKWHPRSKSA